MTTQLLSEAYKNEIVRAAIERQRNKAEIKVNESIIEELSGNTSKIKYSKKLEYRNSDLEYNNKILTQLIENLKDKR